MAPKRGRPLSSDSTAEVNRCRAQVRDRVREFRQRLRVAQLNSTPTPASQAQIEQGTRIIHFSSIENEQAPETPGQVGLRVQGLVLAQDGCDARHLQDARPIDEHNALYDDVRPSRPPPSRNPQTHERLSAADFFRRFQRPSPLNPSSLHSALPTPIRGDSNQAQLSQYFPTLPPANPFADEAFAREPD